MGRWPGYWVPESARCFTLSATRSQHHQGPWNESPILPVAAQWLLFSDQNWSASTPSVHDGEYSVQRSSTYGQRNALFFNKEYVCCSSFPLFDLSSDQFLFYGEHFLTLSSCHQFAGLQRYSPVYFITSQIYTPWGPCGFHSITFPSSRC